MPYRILPGCKVKGCPNRSIVGAGGYCEIHKYLYIKEKSQNSKLYEKYDRGYDHSKRYGANWQKIRNLYIRQNPFCEECEKKGKTTLATLVHHRIPISDGGSNNTDNLESLCNTCHEEIHHHKGKYRD